MYNIYLYQNMICPHVAAFVKAIAARSDVKLTWVVDADILPYRRQMGIELTDCGNANVIITTDEGRIKQIVTDSDYGAIHIVGGMRSAISSRIALLQAAKENRRLGLYTEPGNHNGIKGGLRSLLYKYEYKKWGYKLDFVLATGQLGVDWFARAGYPNKLLFPFCYITQSQLKLLPNDISNQYQISYKIIFCGQLIKRKNIDILLKALKKAKEYNWECSIAGDGELLEKLRNLSNTLGIANRIKWLGVIPNQQLIQLISDSDLLVLPSRFDGWGAVINEALSVGTPVICSDNCGGGELLNESWRGEKVRTYSELHLADALIKRLVAGKLSKYQRENISNWSFENISGEPVAKYFIQIMDHVYDNKQKPIAPWRSSF